MGTPWQYRQMYSQPRMPFPGMASPTPSNWGSVMSSPDLQFSPMGAMSAEEMKEQALAHLTKNPALLEDFVLNNVRVEVIGKWLAQKRAHGDTIATTVDHSEVPPKKNEEVVPRNIILDKIEMGENLSSLYELSEQLRVVTHSSGFSLFSVGPVGKTVILFRRNEKNTSSNTRMKTNPSFLIAKKTTVAAHVASTHEPILVEDVRMDERFPKKTGVEDSQAVSVLCVPVLLACGDLLGVVEFYRSWQDAKYTESDLDFVQTCFNWAAIGIYKTTVCKALSQQTEMSDFLLNVSKSYLDDVADFDQILSHIMRFAKNLVDADRCSLFLYDKETDELYSQLFDTGEVNDGEPVLEKRPELRFSADVGIVGAVARSKDILNIPDAYGDKRFNRDVDKLTGGNHLGRGKIFKTCILGYTTRNILCVPIVSNTDVFGVVEMINKKSDGVFTKADENNFKIFSLFCALALRYSSVHTRLEKNHSKHQVIYEQFLFHFVCSKQDCKYLVERIECGKLAETPMDFDEYYFPIAVYDDELPDFFVRMLRGLCQPDFDVPSDILSRFIVTVRKNYRNIPYHNWKHAMTVTHSMYCILLRNLDMFTKFERFGLLVACLCHDLDHRGFTNEFLQKSNHPLAALYPASTMESHHYHMASLILDSSGHQVFSMLDDEAYGEMLNLVQNAIISTDLALFFGNQRKIKSLMDANELDISAPEHRKVAIGIMMTASDLSSTGKHWEHTKASVFDLYQEFWNEGDLRKENKFPFVDMMDRDKAREIAQGQVGFFTHVSIKCYETLCEILPGCEDMLNLAQDNLNRWRKKVEDDKRAAEGENDDIGNFADILPHGFELGFMLRGGMWVIEKSRNISEK